MRLFTSHNKYFRYRPWDFTFYNTMDILNGLPAKGELTPEQEGALAGDAPTLALHNMREAFAYAKKCCRGMLSDDEIYSSIYESLCAAAKNFKPNRIRFFAYAKPYIRGGLSLVWKSKDVVKRGKNMAMTHIDLYASASTVEHHEDADGLTGILHREKNPPIPPSTEPDIESVQLREEYALIQPLMKSMLTDKEQTVIAFRYKSGMTFERIGKLLDTSRADIQLTHARALKKLRSGARSKLYTIK